MRKRTIRPIDKLPKAKAPPKPGAEAVEMVKASLAKVGAKSRTADEPRAAAGIMTFTNSGVFKGSGPPLPSLTLSDAMKRVSNMANSYAGANAALADSAAGLASAAKQLSATFKGIKIVCDPSLPENSGPVMVGGSIHVTPEWYMDLSDCTIRPVGSKSHGDT